MTNTVTDQPTNLVAIVVERLWHVYGYPGPLDEAHPVTVAAYQRDAEDLIDAIEMSGYRIVAADRWERVRDVAERSATTVERHKREVFARDKFVHEEVEAMNARLQPIYAELTAGYDALQPGDLDEGADHQ